MLGTAASRRRNLGRLVGVGVRMLVVDMERTLCRCSHGCNPSCRLRPRDLERLGLGVDGVRLANTRAMRHLLAIVTALASSAGCADSSPRGDGSDEDEELTKDDSAGAALCDPLSDAARDLCLQIPDNGWRRALAGELAQPYFAELAESVAAARAIDDGSADVHDNIYPAKADTFAALARVSPGRVRAVIVGQDPYIGVGQANGLAFSVAPGIAVPPSLNNIYAELVREADDPTLAVDLPSGFECPANGDLTPWVSRGVLLINAVLTVRHGAAGSHKGFGWQTLTDAMLRIVRDRNKDDPTVFLLWGAFAQAKEPLILGEENGANPEPNPNVRVFRSNHPSPLTSGFVGNGHFASANQFLRERGGRPIDWSLPVATGTTAHSCKEL
jgi:uracil-DNA glycosylase